MSDYRSAVVSGQSAANATLVILIRLRRYGALAAFFAAATMVAGIAPSHAQLSWPNELSEANNRVSEPTKKERRIARRRAGKDTVKVVAKEAAKPVGPLLVSISIDKQQLKLYDRNGLFAESPISTGTRSHPTPMGVFSIIQRSKYHRSNIYSGAPMPYMQRITWSGIAMHAGVLPGYPASHGCIRMPMSFATRMWGWTKMGARVVIAPNEVSPADFTHPRLIARKPEPVIVAVPATAAEVKDVALPPKSEPAPAPGQIADASGGLPQASPDTITAPVAGAAKDSSEDSFKDTAKDAAKDTSKDNKDQARAGEAGKTVGDAKNTAIKSDAATKTDATKTNAVEPAKPLPKRSGHIAAYISGKTGKLYVRQDFEPLFDIPVTIATADKPLGTHVFTMRTNAADANALSWTVVSMPAVVRAPKATESKRKNEKKVAAPVMVPPSSPTEALDRIAIPDDAMQKIAAAIAPGGSLVISDQGLGDETGLGTDFIVPLK